MNLKRLFKWLGIAVATPIAVFLLLAVAIYLPPIQHWVKDKTAAFLSEQTHSHVEIGSVRLAFPLDLAIKDVIATQGRDTLLAASSLRLDLKFWPLLCQEVNLKAFELRNVAVNSKSFLSDIQIIGRLKFFGLRIPATADLTKSLVNLSGVQLEGGDVSILLSDTAQKDTTQREEPSKWRIALKDAQIAHTRFFVRMPHDSMRIGGTIEKARINDGDFDLSRNSYQARHMMFKQSSITYDIPFAAAQKGFDANHIAVTDFNLNADTLRYHDGVVAVKLSQLSGKEQCGLNITGMSGAIYLDSTRISVSSFNLRTPYSQLKAEANVAWKALEVGNKERMNVFVKGGISTHDAKFLIGEQSYKELQLKRDLMLQLDVDAEGNADHIKLKHATAELPQYVSLKMRGATRHITSEKHRKGEFFYELKTAPRSQCSKILPKSVGLNIPSGLSLMGRINFAGSRFGTNSMARLGHGQMSLNGEYDLHSEAYRADVKAHSFPIGLLAGIDSLSSFSGSAKANGRGFDIFHRQTRLNAHVGIDRLHYGKYPLDSIQLHAKLSGGNGEMDFTANNPMVKAETHLKAQIFKKHIEAALQGSLDCLNLSYITGDSIQLMSQLNVSGNFGKDGKNIQTVGNIESINLMNQAMGFMANDIYFGFKTSADSTQGHFYSGDLKMELNSDKPVETIAENLATFADKLTEQLKAAHFDQSDLTASLPNMDFVAQMGKDNPLSQYLRLMGYDAEKLDLRLSTRPNNGLKGDMLLTTFKTGNLLLDQTTMRLYQDSTGVRLSGKVENTSKKNPNRFVAEVEGRILTNGFSIETLFEDEQHKKGLDLGLRADLSPEGDINFHLFPEVSTIAYRKFKVNTDNYLTIGKDKHLSANVDLLADDRTGLKIFTPEGDSTRDISVTLSHVNLQELTSVLPYVPRMSGLLDGDFHAQWKDDELSAVGQLDVSDFGYDETLLGDLGAEFVYIPDKKNNHYIEANLFSNKKDIINLQGNYINDEKGRLDMQMDLIDFPSHLLNAFMASDGTVGLEGTLNGQLMVTGPTDKFLIDGAITPDSLHIISPLYGLNMRADDKPIEIKKSKLHLDNMALHSAANNPLVVNGDVDFSDLDAIRIDMSFKANNFEVVNSPRTKQSLVYGKIYADINATLKGTTDFMIMRGNLDVLDRTNMTYVMKDSPLTVEDRLKGLVEFVDFSDSTETESTQAAAMSGVFVGLNVHINPATKLHVELSSDGSSYFDCEGGGNLSLRYLPAGDIILTGRYSMNSGEMKYALPFIPLKTFELKGDNNYITFTGDTYNPTLHITAMETTRASVCEDNSSTRMVTFNVGVAITQTLNDMGLQFLIEAPEDLSVQNELASMSKEDKGKLAVTLLATGMYLTSNNKSSFKANNALNTFLQSEIQNIAGDALKTIDLTVGLEGSTSASGNAQTDYSFQFAKHLWNDRVTFKIGGKVTAGSETASENQSFIDNISLEYRLGKGTTHNIRLFYDHDAVDPLEGSYSTAGAGFVLRRQTNTFGEIFIFHKPRRKDKSEKK